MLKTGSITSNMAIVSTTDGSIDAFASSDTQLILDVSGYFASPPGPTGAPTVVLIGDSVMTAWLTPAVLAANPHLDCPDITTRCPGDDHTDISKTATSNSITP